MDWRRWRQLTRIHDELETHQLLRDHVASERLYLVDHLEWLIAVIERAAELEEDEALNLFFGDDD
jgi:hypothetical protein